jgi:hypothetical protein
MKKTLTKYSRVISSILLGVLLSSFTFLYIAHRLSTMPQIWEIQAFDNIALDMPFNTRKTIEASRRSTVRLFSKTPDDQVSSTTGTYITANGQHYIITVSHGIFGPCGELAIWTEEEEWLTCKEIVHIDQEADYAIIRIDEIPSRTPISIPEALPDTSEWKQALAVQKQVYYTGYPNNVGPATVDGRIIGVTTGGWTYLHTYAWRGASGSGVFNSDGHFIGYIFAIEVGETEYGYDAFENVIIIVPTFMIDWSTILK